MPYTPFHWGPSSWLGLLLFRYLNFAAFLMASVIIDIEPFCVLVFKLNYPLHGYLHSYFGSSLIAIVLSVILVPSLKLINKVMRWAGLDQQSSYKTILISCLLGVYSHVFLDSFLYTDIKPFLPFAANPFYKLISSSAMYLFCSVSFLVGGIIYVLKLKSVRAIIVLVVSFVLLAISILVVPVILFAQDYSAQATVTVPLGKKEQVQGSTHTVSRVIDGDTLELTNGERVRLIGVDCPEFKDQVRNRRNAERLGIDPEHYTSYAQKAKDYLRRIEGGAVKLEYDEINESVSHRDKYGRILAYVYAYAFAKVRDGFVPDGVSEKWSDDQRKGNVLKLMNAKLIAFGYGFTYRRFDFKHKDKFLKLEAEAKESKRGIWDEGNK
jgi:endonuclease YncB( thermonuclease family)/membrane-bound metal-dependent hydrolase YbcI (DUF457 family)